MEEKGEENSGVCPHLHVKPLHEHIKLSDAQSKGTNKCIFMLRDGKAPAQIFHLLEYPMPLEPSS